MLTLELKGSPDWATYLFYGDASGLKPEEKAQADQWLAQYIPPAYHGPVDMVETSESLEPVTYIFLAD